jgi:amidophosphoribosyltransferase
MLRSAGAREVHADLLASDHRPCFYGIDTPTREELVASSTSIDQIREFIGADSLAYLSEEGLYAFLNGSPRDFCDACFTARYPIPVTDPPEPRQLHLFDALSQRGSVT